MRFSMLVYSKRPQITVLKSMVERLYDLSELLLINNTAFMCSLHCQYISVNVHGRSFKLFTVLHAQSVSVGLDPAWGSLCNSVCYLGLRAFTVILPVILSGSCPYR